MGLVEQSKQAPILAYGVEPYSLKRKLAFYIWSQSTPNFSPGLVTHD